MLWWNVLIKAHCNKNDFKVLCIFLKKIFTKDTIYKSVITIIDALCTFKVASWQSNTKRLNDNDTGPKVFSKLSDSRYLFETMLVHSELFQQKA